jgi:exopolyphosphatase/guanosine-5'-triphosphate,3'-diphosphate pyrophosphatase
MQRRAVIDVGTNSVKLLIADVTEGEVHPVWEGSKQTRLGRGLYETGLLSQESLVATAEVVRQYAADARQQGAMTLRIIATSAAREARNAPELIQLLTEASGVVPEVISGEQEARWAFAGVATQPGRSQLPLLVLDVGGGSTEFVLGQNDVVSYQKSFPLGSVRLFESIQPGDHPGSDGFLRCQTVLKDFLETKVAPTLSQALHQSPPQQVIGVGGTTAILALIRHERADFDRALIESTVLNSVHLDKMVRQLWDLPLAERRKIPGLPPERADVILTGAAIYLAIVEAFGFADLRISTRGLRHAALLA